MLAGSEGLGGIAFEDYGLTFRVGTVALGDIAAQVIGVFERVGGVTRRERVAGERRVADAELVVGDRGVGEGVGRARTGEDDLRVIRARLLGRHFLPVLREKARPLSESDIRTPELQRMIEDVLVAREARRLSRAEVAA